MLEYAYLFLAAVVSFVISANNSSNSVGTLYGSKVTSYYKAAVFSGLMVLVGTLLEGWKMSGAIGGGFLDEPLTLEMSLMVLLSTAILLFLFTHFSMPLSASQLLVGSIIGVAFAFSWKVNRDFLLLVLTSWVLTFILAMLLSLLIYYILLLISHRATPFSMSRFYTVSLFLGSAFIAYTLGANTIGLVASLDLSYASIIISALAALFGVIIYGRKTAVTVGKRITSLDPPRAFSAQLATAIIVEAFTQFHLPASITQAVIGGIIGTGLIKGYRELNGKTLKSLLLSWLVAPLVAFLITYAIVTVLSWHL